MSARTLPATAGVRMLASASAAEVMNLNERGRSWEKMAVPSCCCLM
jgi:hypothetical protein